MKDLDTCNINESAWRKATEDSFGESDECKEGITIREYAKILNRSITTAKGRMRQLCEEGKAVRGWKWFTRHDGMHYKAPAYRLRGKRRK